ncbi:VWA domain-containing protein [Litoribacillus peritrichatus]|uniref:VWA domain-containing protein n=1 Tax=Litoribacillus peritrichatus TaxID=718191 RepID=A0ABP7M0C1_9GAMM
MTFQQTIFPQAISPRSVFARRLFARTTLSLAVLVGLNSLSGCATQNDQTVEADSSSAKKEQLVASEIRHHEEVALVERESKSGQQRSQKKDVRMMAESIAPASAMGQVVHSTTYQMSPVMPAVLPPMDDYNPGYFQEDDREKYAAIEVNPVKQVVTDPVSTFSIDVDSGSYSNVRRMLNQGALPPKDAVRIEEMVNYFDYQYPQPDYQQAPFSVNTELAKSPWSSQQVLLRVGLKGYQPEVAERPSANLVFLLDVSGSMNASDKLPLLKKSLTLLSKQLKETDKVSIVVYAGASGVVLEPTSGNNTHQIERALQQLQAGGSTNGEAGIELAYSMAEQAFIKEGINRVILATDGDFNVGTSSVDALKTLIEQKREKGISLTTLGFGTGNYNDHLMEQLADVGNGNYAYIDGLNEARKVLVDELSSTLMTIAKDVKIQIEFNPGVVAEYRLIGYENRMLAREDFNNDKVDAGEIGAGHTVTALYELTLQGSDALKVDPLRYQQKTPAAGQSVALGELGYLKLRYKQPEGSKSQLMEYPIQAEKVYSDFSAASSDFKFASIVAGFGQKLQGGKYLADFSYQDMIDYAQSSKGQDPFGYRNEFVQLVRMADALTN